MSLDFSTPGLKRDTPTVFPRFYTKAVQNNFRSEKEGRPIFEDKDYVEITVAGDTRTTVDRQVKQEDIDRWPDIYARFKAGQEQATVGTPLEAWSALTAAQVAEYKAMKIFSVDALAALDDSRLMALGTGGRHIRDKARAFLESAASNAPLSAALQEAEGLRAQIAVLETTIHDQAQEIGRLKEKIVEGA
jgi:hypothetical protein